MLFIELFAPKGALNEELRRHQSGGSSPRCLRLSDFMKMVVNPEPKPAERGEPADEPAPDAAVDPVCGMSVVLTETTITLEHDGTTHAFCCGGCRDVFAAQHAAGVE